MANLIQIKRSAATATPLSLANGELAFSSVSDALFIGSPNGSIVAIGGARHPGVLTANQALVANSTGYIDTVKAANLIITSVSANGSYGSNGQVLVSNGTAVYWGTGTSGSNTQVQFNDGGVANGSAAFTFDKTSNTLTVTNIAANSANVTNISGNGASITSVDAATVNGNTASDLNLYTDNKAANAYSNAMSDTLSRDGTYTGNNIFNGTTTTISNNAVLGSNSSHIITINGVVNTNLLASTNNAYDLGGTSNRWKDLYLSGNSIYFNQSVITDTSGTVSTNNFTATSLLKTQDLTVEGNTVLGNNSSDVVSFIAHVNTSITPAANVTYNLGTNNLRWNDFHAQNVHSTTAYFDGTVYVGGDIQVTGNLVTQNVSSVIVSDPLIYLAGNNYTSDVLDIGFVANYNDGSDRHTGFYRDASDGGIYKLFYNSTQELSGNNLVDDTDPTYRIATLKTFLLSGGLVTNSTAVEITANSTVNVAIVANSLSLSTALPATSGGVGHSSYANGDILYASNSTYLSKLALGADGYVLQSNGTSIVYGTLDGGTF